MLVQCSICFRRGSTDEVVPTMLLLVLCCSDRGTRPRLLEVLLVPFLAWLLKKLLVLPVLRVLRVLLVLRVALLRNLLVLLILPLILLPIPLPGLRTLLLLPL